MLQRIDFNREWYKMLQRIPNIVLTSTIPNGTMKLAQRNATINSTNQTSLAAILALNHATNARFTPRSESQAFITSTISSLGERVTPLLYHHYCDYCCFVLCYFKVMHSGALPNPIKQGSHDME